MFKLQRPKYVVKEYAGRKFSQKEIEKISVNDII